LVYHKEEPTLVRQFPISVDFEGISLESQSPEVAAEAESLIEKMGLEGKIIGLGIDRIDYTKGIPHRIRAFGRFLEKYPQYIGKVVFIQAGVMSRTDIGAYQLLAEQVDEELEKVNSRFGTGDWAPIMYLPDDLPAVTLAAFRRMANFCVVSSLHDGMNLVAKEYVATDYFLFLGRGMNSPIASEGSLKLKEISYVHAEAYPAGEMKHGPIALIDSAMATVALAPKDSLYEKVVNNVKEVMARDGRVLAILTEGDTQLAGEVDHALYIPEAPEHLIPLLTVVPLQMLAYHVALLLNRDVDQPRNLAKSVTVE
jgi:hypothetical protein